MILEQIAGVLYVAMVISRLVAMSVYPRRRPPALNPTGG